MSNFLSARSQSRVFLFSFAFLFCFSMILAPSMFSQSASTGALVGTVRDSSGASVPNATVTATSLDTAQARTSTTTAEGTYRFGFLPLGAYKLKFEATGFNTVEVPSVTIIVTETAVLDQVLQVGTQTQQVTVTSEAEQIQTASSTVGTLVAGQTLADLPLTTRNYTTLLGLAAGTNVGVYDAVLMGRGTQDPVVNGALSTQNNYQQDGASLVNTAGTGTGADSGGATTGMGVVNPDSIQEFKIQTSAFDASYGRNSGANVNVVTKSGTNGFHGTAYEFFRNTIFNANEFFRQEAVAPNPNSRPVLNQNQFGGSLGGPVKKDKLFFFASYQRTWQKNGLAAAGASNPSLVGIPLTAGGRGTTTWANGVPTTNAQGLVFAQQLGAAFCPGGPANGTGTGLDKQGVGVQVACNGSNINPVALTILELQTPGSQGTGGYYVPTSATAANPNGLNANGTPGFLTPFSSPAHYFENQGVGNFDYAINSKNTLSGRYFYSTTTTNGTIGTGTTSSSITQGLPGAPGSVEFPTMYMLAKVTTVLSTNMVNEARASLQRSVVYDFPGFNNADGTPVTNTQLGVTPVVPSYDVSNRFTISGNATMAIGTGVSVARKLNTSWELADQISWSHGKHTIRTGFEFERDRMNWYFPAIAGGGNANLTFQSFQDFLLGLPGCSTAQAAAGCTPAAPLAGTNGTPQSNIFSGGTATSLTAVGGDNHFFRTPAGDAFVQDDIKVTSRLTLNLGVRWEYNGLFYDSRGNTTNVWPSLISTVNCPVQTGTCTAANAVGTTPATGTLAGFVVPSNYNASLYTAPTVGGLFMNTLQVPTQNAPPKDAFAPRFGFAWKPLASDRFVVRGGIGVFYDRAGIGAFNSSAVQQYPYAVPVFQASGAANYAATEHVPYPAAIGASLGWGPRYYNLTTNPVTLVQSEVSSAENVNLMDPHFQVPTTYQWNLNTQYEFLPTWVLEVGYVGSHSIHQLYAAIPGGALAVKELNEALLAAPGQPVNGITTNSQANSTYRVPYLGFAPAGLNDLDDGGKTLFDSLQITVRKQLSHGLTLQTAYTWARALTTVDHPLYNNPYLENYGPSSFYRPQRLTISYGWDIPSGHHDGVVGKFVNGWNLSGVTIIQDGLPLTITNTTGGGVYGLSGSSQTSEAEFAAGMTAANMGTPGGVSSRLGIAGQTTGYFNKAAFTTIPTVGAFAASATNPVSAGGTGWGDTGIGNILGPGQFNFDASIVKTTRVGGIHEDATLVFRTEFFNVFNHSQFNVPVSVDASSASFGQITSTSVNPRLIQFALKYVF